MPTLSIPGAIAALCLVLPAAASAQAPDPLPAWMAGRWCGTSPEPRSEEVWLAPAGGLMVGMSRTVSAARAKTQFEFLRIEMREGVPAYLAQPQGRPAVEFRQVQSHEGSIRFENPAHDFPRRIEYRRSGDTLLAEISGPGKEGRDLAIVYAYASCVDQARRP